MNRPNCARILALLLLLGTSPLGAQPAEGFRVDPVVTGLVHPVTFCFAPDGRVFVGERTTGRIRVIRDGQLLPEPFAVLPVCATGERGLLGLAVPPDFARNGHVYAFHTRLPEQQRIIRFTARGDRGLEPTVIVDGIPANVMHNGGGLAFGPDGMLYFSVGDNDERETADDPHRLPGKIHRVRPDGTVPGDNPWPDRSAFCLGLRNVFDFTFLPETRPVIIYASENGPTVDDEIHRITAGEHCGWPVRTGTGRGSRYVDPIHTWKPTTAPVGIAFYDGFQYPREYRGDLFFAEFNTGQIQRLTLDPTGRSVQRSEVFLQGGYGRLFDLGLAPDGTLWFSNADGIYRIVSDHPAPGFIRGDVDGLGGVNVHDAAALLVYVVSGGPRPACEAAADVNADDVIDMLDATALLGFLFGVLPDPPAPYPDCGSARGERLECDREPCP